MISFCVLIIGILIALRTFQETLANFALTKKDEDLIYALFFVVLTCTCLLFYQSLIVLWCIFGIFLISLILIQKNFLKIKNYLFQRQIPGIIENIYQTMRSGQSLRSAIEGESKRVANLYRSIFVEILQQVETEKNNLVDLKGLVVADFMTSIALIEKKKFGALQALNQYRISLKMKENFRRRSSRIYSQVYAQCLVLSILFVFVLLFNLSQFEWSELKKFFAAAVTFFVAGIFFMFKIGRNIKWKM